MSAESSGRSSLWPQIFTKRRDFCRKSENQPYIEFLQISWFKGEECEGEEEESDGSESGSESEGGEDNEDYAEEEDASSGLGNRDEGDTINRRNTDQGLTDDSKAKASNEPSNVRLFMKGFSGGEEDDLYHRDQVEEVASICEQANVEDGMVAKTGKHRKRVALIDDRNIRSTILTDGDISLSGDCRPYLGPLTAEGLGKELRKKVAQISRHYRSSNTNTPRSVSE